MKNSLIVLLIFLLFSGCASRVQPTGGPKDEAPPKLVFSSPLPGERNYKGQEITLEFSEFVTTKSLKEQLIITPRIEGTYSYKLRKRSVILEFDEPFADSTTYSLNFREGIVDITEGNSAENLTLAFSTGNLLDTLKISGTIVDLLTREPKAGVTVGLYTLTDTLNLFTGPPYYFTETNAKGDYTFKNIKDGTYRLICFKDNNKNLTCQSIREPYGFQVKPIKLDTAYVADTLLLQLLNIEDLALTRTSNSGRYMVANANKYLEKASLTSSDGNKICFKFTDEHNGLKIYNTFPIKDSLRVYATLQDSIGIVVKDTFYLRFPETSRKADDFKANLKEPVASIKYDVINGSVGFDKPIKVMAFDSVSIKRDTTEIYYIKDYMTIVMDTLNNILTYQIKLPQQVKDSISAASTPKDFRAKVLTVKKAVKPIYMLNFPPASFISVEDDTLAVLAKRINFIESSETGMLTGAVSTEYPSYTIQLLDAKFKLVSEQQNVKKYLFDEIKPGEYYIRIMVDENNNGRWDPGNIMFQQPPEKVILHADDTGNSKTSIRANWELTVDLNF